MTTMRKIIDVAEKTYPDGLIGLYFTDPDGDHGDLLARFIVKELSETFDPTNSTGGQWHEAARVMRVAQKELDRLVSAFETEERNTVLPQRVTQ